MGTNNALIISVIRDLITKVQLSVPETGDFVPVYSECRIDDRSLCLTDILLKVEPVPCHLENSTNQRYLTCVGYKLPTPIKSTCIILKGNKEAIIHLLRQESLIERIGAVIEKINYNLIDV